MPAESVNPGVPGACCKSTRRHAVLCLAAVLLLPQLPACATDSVGRGQLVEMSIVDRETGQTLTPYRKDGRTFVAGNPAARYSIRLANRSGGRVLVVLSVDGVNVISGETAAFAQTGYVLDPWRSYEITGWRKSDTAVAAFVFAARADSYAARTGRPDNVGVIGMAAFTEKPQPPVVGLAPAPSVAERTGRADEPARRAEAAKSEAAGGNSARPSAPSSSLAGSVAAGEAGPAADARVAQRDHLGTAHGEREWSVSRRTNFERASSTPQQVFEIAYDSYANLVLAGVIPAPIAARARPFPGDEPRGFVPDPPSP